ncbi:MAG: hypothetical protein KF723_21635 [Rhizobiaceae bacterium]|nr:hypothetical protein [Rhizobiaceae bacterium]
MDQTVEKHHKIRFRRGDVTGFETFPSALAHRYLIRGTRRRSRLLRIGAAAAGVLAALVALAGLALYFVGVYGISTERVHERAEAAIHELLGLDVDATLGPARVRVGGSGLLSVAIDEIRLVDRATGEPVLEAAALDFGVEIIPLLGGDVEFSSIGLRDARLSVAALPEGGGQDWSAALRNAEGLIDADRIAAVTFDTLRQVFAMVDEDGSRSIRLSGLDITLPPGGRVSTARIDDAAFDVDSDAASVSFTAEVNGRTLTLEGSAGRDAAGRIETLALQAGASAPQDEPAPDDRSDRFGAVSIAVEGGEGAEGQAGSLALSLKVGSSRVWLDREDSIEGTLDVLVALAGGRSSADIERALFVSGGSSFDFHGAIGPRAPAEGRAGSYRLELISDGSVAAPSDSTEPALDFVARIAGTFDPEGLVVSLDEVGLRTEGGEMAATARVDFEAGQAPGITFAADVTEMPVQHVKQLWPYYAAPGARRWALTNLFGGSIRNSSIRYSVPPGRMGNGVPLSHDEVFGRFELAGARFDVTGEIPPVRDAMGIVEFKGNDVDVTLSAGTAYMSSGDAVTIGNGRLTIVGANRPVVAGDLDIDIAGKAQSIAELASAEPINALEDLGLSAPDFSGQVKGHVKTQVPISGGLKLADLDWLVSLDYTNLTLAKPIDGQMFSDGNGTIVVDPDKAVITAKAKLNGAPAELALLQPLGSSKTPRQQTVVVTLDDKAREEFVPGLGDLLSGPVRVTLDMGEKGRRSVSADLSAATLTLPWVGWTKGPGIAGAISFDLVTDGDAARLSDLKLRGKSFAIDGNVTLNKGSLTAANFSSVQLNRDDNAGLSIDRSGKTLKVTIRGKSLDVRSIVTQIMEDSEAATSATGSTPVSVDAQVASLTGFHGEKLVGVNLIYRGAGSRLDRLEVSATTPGGAPVVLNDRTEDNRRRLAMESTDAGAVLRFLDIYAHMEGGQIRFALEGNAGGTMKGQIDARDFWVVNEPKLASIVSSRPPGDQRSLSEAVRSDIDTTRVKFERGYALLEKGDGSLALERGVLRGPLIGSTFQGTLYDRNSNINMTGTFMPAYGINRIFGEIPLVGIILGNGRDRGLIGVTYRLHGRSSDPDLQINPLSIIAPGIFRSIFEFR